MSVRGKAGSQTDLQRLRASARFLAGGTACARSWIYVLCLFRSRLLEPRWCISLKFCLCPETDPEQSPLYLWSSAQGQLIHLDVFGTGPATCRMGVGWEGKGVAWISYTTHEARL